MLVYHGSYMEVASPDLSHGRNKLDFGKGFYVTTLKEQAEKWAKRQTESINKNPIVSIYEFKTDDLNILGFEGYTLEWLDFVVENRDGKFKPHEYDAIYGNIADDDVVTIVNDYMRMHRRGRMTSTAKAFYLEQLQYEKPNNQYCITSQKGIEKLKFIESYEV